MLLASPAGNSLRNFCVRRIPILRLRLDCQFNWSVVVPTEFLKVANVDFADQFKPAFRRLFQTLSKHVRMFRERDHRKATDRYVFSGEEARRDAFAVPLVRENAADNVLFSADGHRSSYQA